MRLKKKDLINLPVYTKSNQYLGKIVDFELEPFSHTIVVYHVKSKDIIKELLQKELLIAKEQVILISEEKMVVDDLVVKDEKKVMLKKPVPAS